MRQVPLLEPRLAGVGEPGGDPVIGIDQLPQLVQEELDLAEELVPVLLHDHGVRALADLDHAPVGRAGQAGEHLPRHRVRPGPGPAAVPGYARRPRSPGPWRTVARRPALLPAVDPPLGRA